MAINDHRLAQPDDRSIAELVADKVDFEKRMAEKDESSASELDPAFYNHCRGQLEKAWPGQDIPSQAVEHYAAQLVWLRSQF